MKKRSARQLGKLGEDTLRSYAHQIEGLTVNKAEEDERGWDFLLEFSPANLLPYDKRSEGVTCLVQVKATDGKKKKQNIKLSNWERLAKSPYPAFFLICEFDGLKECQRAYLIHVDEERIRQVLKRLRQLSLSDRPLYKSKLLLKYDDNQLLISMDGAGLSQKIAKSIRSDFEKYIEKKKDFVKSVGYENEGYLINMEFSVPQTSSDPSEYFVDFLLGTVPFIEPVDLEIEDHRFGIKSPEVKFLKKMRVEITNTSPFGIGKAFFSLPSLGKECRIDIEFYIPKGISLELAQKHNKILFKAPFLEFTMKVSGSGQLTLTVPEPDETYSLADLQVFANLSSLFSQAAEGNELIKCEISLSIQDHLGKHEELAKAFTGYLAIEKSPEIIPAEIIKVIQDAWTIAKYRDIQNDIKTQVRQLVVNKKQLAVISSILDPNQQISLRVTNLLIHSLDKSKDICVPLLFTVPIGVYYLHLALIIIESFSMLEEMSESPGEWQFPTGKIQIHDSRLLPAHGNHEEQRTVLLQSLIEDYEEISNVIINNKFLTYKKEKLNVPKNENVNHDS